ncbi:MAG: hypothetical protein COA88_06480 [Kordia sp.]|nr:MAG: hypothetical protein COA88_06480 [Kordia sp.]
MIDCLTQTYSVPLLRKRERDTFHIRCDTNTFEGYKRTLSLLNSDLTLYVYCLSTNLFETFLLTIIEHELDYKKKY